MSCNCSSKNEAGMGAMSTLACDSYGALLDNMDNNCGLECPDVIKFKGICPTETLENLLDTTDTLWTEIHLPEILCVPPQKPDIEQIMSVAACIDIISKRVVKTPADKDVDGNDVEVTNNEGVITTGRKLVIEGILRQKIIYTAAVKEQSVHAVHFDVPFSTFIILEANSYLTTNYDVTACIEDIFICAVSKRQIFKNLTLFFKATPIECQ